MSNQLSQQLRDECTWLEKGIWAGSQYHLLCSDKHADHFYSDDDGDGNTRSGTAAGGGLLPLLAALSLVGMGVMVRMAVGGMVVVAVMMLVSQ